MAASLNRDDPHVPRHYPTNPLGSLRLCLSVAEEYMATESVNVASKVMRIISSLALEFYLY